MTQPISLELEFVNQKHTVTLVGVHNTNTMKLMVATPLVFKKGSAPESTFDYEIKEKLDNPIGFIVDKVRRFAGYNEGLVKAHHNGREIDLLKKPKSERDLIREVHYLGNEEVALTDTLVVAVINEQGERTVIHESTVEEYVNHETVSLEHKRVELPTKLDKEGYPRFTNNPKINQFFFENKISAEYDLKPIIVALNNHSPFIQKLLTESRVGAIKELSSELLADIPKVMKSYGEKNAFSHFQRKLKAGLYQSQKPKHFIIQTDKLQKAVDAISPPDPAQAINRLIETPELQELVKR